MKTQIKFLFIIILAAFFAVSCTQEEKQVKEIKPTKVKVAAVEQVTQSFPITASGSLASKTEAKLSFKTGGIIAAIYAGEGQTVKQGTLLAKLDLAEIEAQVRQAELAYEKAKRDLGRVENLYRDSVATLENFQNATTGLEVAESTLKIARFNLQYSKILAPSNGKILRKLASENELISSGMPVFLFAPTKEEMVVRVNLTDRDIVRIELRDRAEIKFDAWPGETFSAKVTEIANAADPYTGTYEVEIELEPTKRKLLSGFIARVGIIPGEENSFLKIPVEALVDGRGDDGYVFTVSDNKAIRKKVRISRIDGDKLIITGGLKSSDSVITEGAQYVEDNAKVDIIG